MQCTSGQYHMVYKVNQGCESCSVSGVAHQCALRNQRATSTSSSTHPHTHTHTSAIQHLPVNLLAGGNTAAAATSAAVPVCARAVSEASIPPLSGPSHSQRANEHSLDCVGGVSGGSAGPQTGRWWAVVTVDACLGAACVAPPPAVLRRGQQPGALSLTSDTDPSWESPSIN